MFDNGWVSGQRVQPERLADVITGIRQPPMVGLDLLEQRTSGVLLCWGRHRSAGWIGGVAVLLTQQHRRELLTMWLPSHPLRPTSAASYGDVPRTVLRGRADQWPALPAVYPGAGLEWRQRHRQVVYRPEHDRR